MATMKANGSPVSVTISLNDASSAHPYVVEIITPGRPTRRLDCLSYPSALDAAQSALVRAHRSVSGHALLSREPREDGWWALPTIPADGSDEERAAMLERRWAAERRHIEEMAAFNPATIELARMRNRRNRRWDVRLRRRLGLPVGEVKI